MFLFLCKNLKQISSRASTRSSHGHFFSTKSLKSVSDLSKSTNPHSLTVTYLVYSCGLPLDSAISVSKKIEIETTEKPDSVLMLFKSHGFTKKHISDFITKRPKLLLVDSEKTLKPKLNFFMSLGISPDDFAKLLTAQPHVLEKESDLVIKFLKTHGFNKTQITSFITKRPRLLLCNLDNNLKPKFEFFKSLGISSPQLARMFSAEPYILERSLDNHIIPLINFLKRFLHTDDNIITATKQCYRILESNVEKVMGPNISTLQSYGLSESMILRLIMIQPKALIVLPDRFNVIVKEVNKLGFNPTTVLFLLAVRTMAVVGESKWEKKMEAYKSFGWSKEETLSAFKLQPLCMLASEKKIRKIMDFFVNKLLWNPSLVSRFPNLLLLSLEKTIIPRCLVVQVLTSKGLIEKYFSVLYMFKMPEKDFLKRFVFKHQVEFPEILKAYQGKMEIEGCYLGECEWLRYCRRPVQKPRKPRAQLHLL